MEEEEDAPRRGSSSAGGWRRRTAASSSSSSSVFNRLGPRVQPYVPQPVHDPPLPGMIFGCTTDTYQECMARQLFGLPERNRNQVLRVVPGSKLFLFNYRVKEMSGIFEATGHGGMNIVQDAFKGLFPAQVKIRCISTCPNLPATIFKRAIRENYFDISKFKYELTTIQVGRLLELFKKKAEYVTRYLTMVDCHYIHASQNCQEPEYQKQPQRHQPKHSRKRTAKEAIEGQIILEMRQSAFDHGPSTLVATSGHHSAEPITTVSALTLHQVLEAQELHRTAPPEATKVQKATPPIEQNKKLADCSLEEWDMETGTCACTAVKLVSDTRRHSMRTEESQLLAGRRQESVKDSAFKRNSKPIALSVTNEVISVSSVKAVPGLDMRQKENEGDVSIEELGQKVQNDGLRNDETLELKNGDGTCMETDTLDGVKTLDPSTRSLDKMKVTLPDLGELQMQHSLKVVEQEREEGELVEMVAVKLHNQDSNSQESGKHEGYQTLDTSIGHVQKLRLPCPVYSEMENSSKVVEEEKGEEGELQDIGAVQLSDQDGMNMETSTQNDGRLLDASTRGVDQRKAWLPSELDMQHTTKAEEQKVIKEGKLDSVTSLPVPGFSLVFETITSVVVDKSKCAEDVIGSGLQKRWRIEGYSADSRTHHNGDKADGLQTAEKVVVCACGDPQGFPAMEMTMDFATTCGHEAAHLSSEGEPAMEMIMDFSACGHGAVHLASESEDGTNISKHTLLVVGREQNLEDTTISARDVEKKLEELEKGSASIQETFLAVETTASGALAVASKHEVQDTVVSCGVINKQSCAVVAAVQLKVEGAEGSQALEGAEISELSKSGVCLKLDGMECESEIPKKSSMEVDCSSSVGGDEPQIVDGVVLELDYAQRCDGASCKEAVEDPAVAHDTAASPVHPDDNTDEVIELDLNMEEEAEAKDTEVAAGNQAIGKRDRSIRDITPWKLLGRSL